MAATYELIESVVLGSAAATVTFSGIPGTFDDLAVLVSARSTRTSTVANAEFYLNGSSTGQSFRYIISFTSTVSSGSNTGNFPFKISAASTTANTFASMEIYIPNYAGATSKSLSATNVFSSNSSSDYNFERGILAGLRSSTDAITSITFTHRVLDDANYASGSTFHLYGITKANDNSPGTFGIQATGGDEVTISGGYKYHVFKSSGTFNVTEPGFVEVLAIAGGGGGGGLGGGGGGGGVLTLGTHRRINSGSYPVLVGAGGSGVSANSMTSGNNGNDSSVAGIVAIGGGGGGTYGGGGRGNDGGSGGGAGTSGVTASSGISGQGNNGGTGFSAVSPNVINGGGGGGYSAVGGNAGTFTGGNGGQGYTLPTDLQPLLDNFTVVSSGGGGGARFNTFSTNGTPGTGGTGAGNGSTNGATAGSATTYGGAGGGSGQTAPSGTWGASGNGYQGIIIIRYPVS